jgi:hypothetical protein
MGATDQELVHEIFEACAELSRRTGRSVTPDGHLVGSLGEIYAASSLNLNLENASNTGFDATDSHGQRVEIKTTTRASISLSAEGTLAQRLVVVKLNSEDGQASIVYDGPANKAWDQAGKPQKNGQRRISLAKLTNDA